MMCKLPEDEMRCLAVSKIFRPSFLQVTYHTAKKCRRIYKTFKDLIYMLYCSSPLASVHLRPSMASRWSFPAEHPPSPRVQSTSPVHFPCQSPPPKSLAQSSQIRWTPCMCIFLHVEFFFYLLLFYKWIPLNGPSSSL